MQINSMNLRKAILDFLLASFLIFSKQNVIQSKFPGIFNLQFIEITENPSFASDTSRNSLFQSYEHG